MTIFPHSIILYTGVVCGVVCVVFIMRIIHALSDNGSIRPQIMEYMDIHMMQIALQALYVFLVWMILFWGQWVVVMYRYGMVGV